MLKANPTVGIARQVMRDADLGFQSDYGLTTNVIQDPDQNIEDEMSLVELKTNEKNCRPFPLDDGEVASVKIDGDHGTLGQAVIYTAGDLVNCLAC